MGKESNMRGRAKKRRLKTPYLRRRRQKMMRQCALLLCAALLVGGGLLLGSYLHRLHRASSVNTELSEIRVADAATAQNDGSRRDTALPAQGEEQDFQYIGTELLPECRTLYQINPDLVGWLTVPGELDLPVVYRDNTYYLNHDFYGRDNDSGTIFLDEAHPFEKDTQYLFFHGHNVWDGSMLGNLTHYRNQDYYEENPYLYFNSLYRRETYEVFAVLTVAQEDMYGLLRLGTPSFENGAEFNSFIDSLQRRALRFTDKQISPDDALMALSTCWQDERIVVLFRRVDRNAGA